MRRLLTPAGLLLTSLLLLPTLSLIGIERVAARTPPGTFPQQLPVEDAPELNEPVPDPQPAPFVPAREGGVSFLNHCRLPATLDLLANDADQDEAAEEKMTCLRERYRQLVDLKQELLGAAGLEAEIELQERHVKELEALRELQKLQRHLQEMSDKFPETDAGRRAKQMLQLLQNRAAPTPIWQPDDSFANPSQPASPRPTPLPQVDGSDESPIIRRRRSVPDAAPTPRPVNEDSSFNTPFRRRSVLPTPAESEVPPEAGRRPQADNEETLGRLFRSSP